MSGNVHRQTCTKLGKSQSLQWNVLAVPLIEVTTFMVLVHWFWWLGIELRFHPSNAWFRVVHGVKRVNHSELSVFALTVSVAVLISSDNKKVVTCCMLWGMYRFQDLLGTLLQKHGLYLVPLCDWVTFFHNFFLTFLSVPRLLTSQFAAYLRGELGSQFLLLHRYCYGRAGLSCVGYMGKNGMIAHIGLHKLKEADLR